MARLSLRLATIANISALSIIGLSDIVYAEAEVGSYTEINLLGTPDSKRVSGLSPNVSSSTTVSAASAFASATGTTVKAFTTSNNIGLSNGSLASSFFRNPFTLRGNSQNINIPLIFNFSLTGNLKTSTAAGQGASISNASLNYTIVNYDFSGTSLYTEAKGNLTVTDQAGANVYLFKSGGFGNTTPKVTFTPTIQIGPDVTKVIPKDYLDSIGLPKEALEYFLPKVEVTSEELKIQQFQATNPIKEKVIQAIAGRGIPSLSIIPGTQVSVGFDVSYGFNSIIPSSQIIQKNGRLDVDIISQAKTGIIAAESTSNFNSTLQLLSINIPDEFTAIDPEQLSVLFDSGDIIPVTRAGTIPPDGTPEPIPTPALFPGIIGLTLKIVRQRKIDQQSST